MIVVRIKFIQMAGTMTACLQGMDTENAFLHALGRANTWKIAGQQLELFDSASNVIARFQARSPE